MLRASKILHPIQFLGGTKFADAKSVSIKIKKKRKITAANAVDEQNNGGGNLVQAICN